VGWHGDEGTGIATGNRRTLGRVKCRMMTQTEKLKDNKDDESDRGHPSQSGRSRLVVRLIFHS
jgi:hypothetical protein